MEERVNAWTITAIYLLSKGEDCIDTVYTEAIYGFAYFARMCLLKDPIAVHGDSDKDKVILGCLNTLYKDEDEDSDLLEELIFDLQDRLTEGGE